MELQGALESPIIVKRERSPDLQQVHETPNAKRHASDATGVVPAPANFPWRVCGASEDKERLKIKEKAVIQAEEYCRQIRTALGPALCASPDSPEAVMMGLKIVNDWCVKHEQIRNKNRSCHILVGVEGPTGAGKSSFLGSLLEIKDLLPSGQEAASTAVVCKTSYNWVNVPGRQFRAQISFREKSEIANKLKSLLEDLKRWSDLMNEHEDEDEDDSENDDEGEADDENNDEEGDDDGESGCDTTGDDDEDIDDTIELLRNTIDYQLPEVQAVWDMDEEQLLQLAMRCPEEMTYKEAAESIFQRNSTSTKFLKNGKEEFNAETAEFLSYSIKPFLDSSSTLEDKGNQFYPWPLVKGVHIYVKADILKPGITLVDLPGCGDVVESRSEVAQKVSHTLDVRMVVSPIIRATDEKQGQALMKNGFDEAQMRMRGKMNGLGFCVIASKMDDMVVDSYIAGSPELARDTEVIQKKTRLGDLEHEKATLKGRCAELKGYKEHAKRQFNKAATQYESATQSHLSQLQVNPNTDRTHLLTVQARRNKANDDLNDAEEQLNEHELRQKQIPVKISNIRHWIHHRAFQTRNTRVIKCLRAGFAKRQIRFNHERRSRKPQADSTFTLPIHPVSTKAFWQLKNNDSPMFGFPDQRCTGVPAVKKWIHQATLAKREKHLDAILDGYEKLMSLMRTYSATNSQYGGLNFTRSEVQAALAYTHGYYTSKLSSKLAEACHEIHKLDLLEHKDLAEERFLHEAPTIVQKWAYKEVDDPRGKNKVQRMAHATYDAILRRDGATYTSPSSGITYTWIENLATPIIETLSRDWSSKLYKQLPLIRTPMMSHYSELFSQYLDAIQRVINKHIPILAARFQKLRPTLEDCQNTTETKIDEVLRTLSEKAVIDTLNVAPRLRSQMIPSFRAAIIDRGTGVYARRREAMEKRIREDGQFMCDEALEGLVDNVANRINNMPAQLRRAAQQGPLNVQEQISCLVNNLAENCSTDPTMKEKKAEVQHNARALVKSWEAAWAEKGNLEEHILDLDLSIPDTLPETVI
ncbi:hypothetical protein ACHAPO_000013 [Fusarium lateritium]